MNLRCLQYKTLYSYCSFKCTLGGWLVKIEAFVIKFLIRLLVPEPHFQGLYKLLGDSSVLDVCVNKALKGMDTPVLLLTSA